MRNLGTCIGLKEAADWGRPLLTPCMIAMPLRCSRLLGDKVELASPLLLVPRLPAMSFWPRNTSGSKSCISCYAAISQSANCQKIDNDDVKQPPLTTFQNQPERELQICSSASAFSAASCSCKNALVVTRDLFYRWMCTWEAALAAAATFSLPRLKSSMASSLASWLLIARPSLHDKFHCHQMED